MSFFIQFLYVCIKTKIDIVCLFAYLCFLPCFNVRIFLFIENSFFYLSNFRLEEKGIHHRKESRIYYMRNFNNFIKSMLIQEYVDRILNNKPEGEEKKFNVSFIMPTVYVFFIVVQNWFLFNEDMHWSHARKILNYSLKLKSNKVILCTLNPISLVFTEILSFSQKTLLLFSIL